MKRTLFALGSTPRLAHLELQSLLPNVTTLITGISVVNESVDAAVLMKSLGGTIKIISVVDEVDEVTSDFLVKILAPQATGGKIVFGISIYGDRKKVSAQVLREVKQTLIASGVSTRYVEASSDAALSSVVITKQRVIDIAIVARDTTFVIGQTTAVQDFEDWNTRDYSRPAADPHRGMLPPKVARMIVNIAKRGVSVDEKHILLDPFCGVGTVLTEALLSGWGVVGSDIDADAVEKTKKNLAWAQAHYGLRTKSAPKVTIGDATHVSDVLGTGSVDAVVTEPFLGNLSLTAHGKEIKVEQVKNTLKGLEKLYIGCLREWANILKPQGTVVIALPMYAVGGRLLTVKNLVDRCESLGYTLVDGPIEYSRPQAIVRREFYIFQKLVS